MPKRVEKALKEMAIRKGYEKDSPQYKRYVYGALNRIKQDRKEHNASP